MTGLGQRGSMSEIGNGISDQDGIDSFPFFLTDFTQSKTGSSYSFLVSRKPS